MKTIEIVVPCYNEEGCIEPLYDAVKDVFDRRRRHGGFGCEPVYCHMLFFAQAKQAITYRFVSVHSRPLFRSSDCFYKQIIPKLLDKVGYI